MRSLDPPICMQNEAAGMTEAAGIGLRRKFDVMPDRSEPANEPIVEARLEFEGF